MSKLILALILLTNLTISANLTDYQSKIIHSHARFTVTEAGTKTGKTYSHLYWLFKEAHTPWEGKDTDWLVGKNYWWVAPVYQQSEIAYRRLQRKIANVPGYKCNDSKLTLITPYGSMVWFKTAKDPNNLYGEDVYAAVFDEFTRSKEPAWHALRSTLTATRAKCKFIGNYTGNANWGHQLGLKAKTDPQYEYFKITAWDAVKEGILSEAEILQAQKDLPGWLFKALYLAEGDIDQARLISNDDISDLFTNTHIQGGRKYMTCDIAFQGSDMFVIWIWEGFKAIDCIAIDKCDSSEVEKMIKGLAEKHHIQRSHIAYDADGIGSFLKGYLKGAIAFHNGGAPIKEQGQKMEYKNLKAQCSFKAAERINNGGYYIDCDLGKHKNDFIEDLEMVKNRMFGVEGKLETLRKSEIREYIGRSPDYWDAFMMREIFEMKPRGGIKATSIKVR